jgi:hypothetical protein
MCLNGAYSVLGEVDITVSKDVTAMSISNMLHAQGLLEPMGNGRIKRVNNNK